MSLIFQNHCYMDKKLVLIVLTIKGKDSIEHLVCQDYDTCLLMTTYQYDLDSSVHGST